MADACCGTPTVDLEAGGGWGDRWKTIAAGVAAVAWTSGVVAGFADAAGGFRALALGHQPGRAHAMGSRAQAQCARIQVMRSQQTRANLLQWMRTQSQTKACVIGQGVLRL